MSPDPDPKPWWADWADTAGPRAVSLGALLARAAARHDAAQGVEELCAAVLRGTAPCAA